MGYTTDFIGHINVHPALNAQEISYLEAFARSRRFDRDGDVYRVPGNPAAERDAEIPAQVYNTVATGQPGYWCSWVPCWDGCCIALDGSEKIYGAAEWLEYLIDHFLSPGAQGEASGHDQLAGFTFDHTLSGLVVGCRRDNKELFAIVVEDNEVSRVVLEPADPAYVDYPPLPYEETIDAYRALRMRRPSPRAKVVDLMARRDRPA